MYQHICRGQVQAALPEVIENIAQLLHHTSGRMSAFNVRTLNAISPPHTLSYKHVLLRVLAFFGKPFFCLDLFGGTIQCCFAYLKPKIYVCVVLFIYIFWY